MTRVGMLSIVLAAAVTGACGGAESVSSSPTGPSTTTTTTSSQPQPLAAGMRADEPARGQRPGHSGHARVERRERRDRVLGARRVDPGQLGSALDEHDEYQLHLDRERLAGSSRAYRRSATASSAARRTKWISPSATRADGGTSTDGTGQSLGRSVFAKRLTRSRLSSRSGRTDGQATIRGSWPEARDGRGRPR